jgi:hypothetical protein
LRGGNHRNGSQLVVERDDRSIPVPIPENRTAPITPLWSLLKELGVGESLRVNRSASYIRVLASKLAKREADTAQRRAMAQRRYKVREVGEGTVRVWRLK